MAELSKGGRSRPATTGRASTRPGARSIAIRSGGRRGICARTRAWASSTDSIGLVLLGRIRGRDRRGCAGRYHVRGGRAAGRGLGRRGGRRRGLGGGSG